MQVLDPSVVHGPTRRHQIGSIDLAVAVAVANLAFMFEVPLHSSTAIESIEDIKNSFAAFRASDVCAAL